MISQENVIEKVSTFLKRLREGAFADNIQEAFKQLDSLVGVFPHTGDFLSNDLATYHLEKG